MIFGDFGEIPAISMESWNSHKHLAILVLFTHSGLPGFLENQLFPGFPGILGVPDASIPQGSLRVCEIPMNPSRIPDSQKIKKLFSDTTDGVACCGTVHSN